MPIYEYRCPSCGHDFDKMQKVSAPTPACPSCGFEEVKKRVSKTSFQLKGGGWYVTDYKSGGNTSGASASSSSEKTETSDSADSSTESSTASSTETSSASESTTSGGSDSTDAA